MVVRYSADLISAYEELEAQCKHNMRTHAPRGLALSGYGPARYTTLG